MPPASIDDAIQALGNAKDSTQPLGPGAGSLPTLEELKDRIPQVTIQALIGRGGMGAVYRGHQERLDRPVAVKILPPQEGQDPDLVTRFLREARTLAKLNHPGIVTVHDYGQEGGLAWMVMELVDGANLRQVMQTGRLSAGEILTLIPRLCDALQYAHDHGVIHRDLKPENILLDARGWPKIADFGLAKRNAGADDLTDTGQVLGSLKYMAPEQLEGSASVDHRADLYALGVMIYEMLTGSLPLGRFPPPSQRVAIDVRMDEVVLRSLEREPERRWQQASQVQHAVEHINRGPAAVPGPAAAPGLAVQPPLVSLSPEAPGFWARLRNLCRSRNDRVISGVCGGLGTLGPVPAWIWRMILLVALFIFTDQGKHWNGWGGFLVLFYIGLCVVMPKERNT